MNQRDTIDQALDTQMIRVSWNNSFRLLTGFVGEEKKRKKTKENRLITAADLPTGADAVPKPLNPESPSPILSFPL